MRDTGSRWCDDIVLEYLRLLPKLLPPPFLAALCLALATSPLAQAQDATSMTLSAAPSKTATPAPAPDKPTLEIWAGTLDHQKPAPVPGQTPSEGEPATPAAKAKQGTSAKRHATPATIPEAVADDPRRRVFGSEALAPLSSAPVPGQTPSEGEPATPAAKAKQGTSAKRHATPAASPEPGVEDLTSLASAKADVVSDPLPNYPYQAKNHHITGDGACVMTVDAASGKVTELTMEQSTGNPILDKTTTEAFKQWRFKPGTVSRVRVPITYKPAYGVIRTRIVLDHVEVYENVGPH